MPEQVEMQDVWTVWEIRDSFHVLDWLRTNAYDPNERQGNPVPFPVTAWELRGNPAVGAELARIYAYRLN